MISTCAGTAGRLGDLRFINMNGTGNLVAQAGIRAISDGAVDSTAMSFFTEVTGGSFTEKMRITAAGNVGIGVTPTNRLECAPRPKRCHLHAGVQCNSRNGSSSGLPVDRKRLGQFCWDSPSRPVTRPQISLSLMGQLLESGSASSGGLGISQAGALPIDAVYKWRRAYDHQLYRQRRDWGFCTRDKRSALGPTLHNCRSTKYCAGHADQKRRRFWQLRCNALWRRGVRWVYRLTSIIRRHRVECCPLLSRRSRLIDANKKRRCYQIAP